MSRKPNAIKIDEISELQFETPGRGWNLLARSGGLILPLSLAFAVLVIVTAGVQINAGAQSLYRSEQNVLTSKTLTPPRGLFYDRSGTKLTINVNSYTLSLDPKDFSKESLDATLSVIADKAGVPIDDLISKLNQAKTGKVVLLKGLTSAQAIVLTDQLKDKAVDIVTDVNRQYLYPYEYSQVLGYTGLTDVNDLKAGLSADDIVGKYRLEKILDEQLRGVKGQQINSVAGESTVSGLPGNNVFLTIDNRWQEWLYKILGHQVDQWGGQGGAAVVVDVSNGDIWAYASYPSFDPNKFTGGISSADYKQLLEDSRKPLVDKVIGTQTSPGSTYKLIAAYAGLENGVIDENTSVFSDRCIYLGGGYPFCEFGKFFLGDLDIKRALTRSSNIFFCDAILRLTREQGFQKYLDAAKAMGIGTKTGIMLDGELSGLLASPELKLKLTGQTWFDGDICNSIIGQGMTSVTPIQMAMMVSTFYNGGKYYQPNLVARIEDQQGNVVKSDFTKLLHEVPMKDKTRDLIQAGMYDVVNSTEGTDYWYLHHIPLNFYAKTGSAEVVDFSSGHEEDKVDGWIEGKFDYQGRTFAFVSDIRFAGGGWNASQVIMRFGNCLVNDFADGCDQI